jgi:quinolinate synthase
MNLCLNEQGTESFVEGSYSSATMDRIRSLKQQIGNDILILGHHYQQDEVLSFADIVGDSYELSKFASGIKDKKYIVFCGVHFMAETADILTDDSQVVIIPDTNAGCSMSDMASLEDVEDAFELISKKNPNEKIIPITYMNSSADIKAFVGKNGGIICTSANAQKALTWAFNNGDKVLFLPDQHLGRNTAYKMGYSLDEMQLWDYKKTEFTEELNNILNKKIILWNGYCSVHMNFKEEHISLMKSKYPDVNIIVHPECRFEVVQKADIVGSTSFIVNVIKEASDGTRWAIGTEHHLVKRLQELYPKKIITTLAPFTCQCATMSRITLDMLEKSLVAIMNKKNINRIEVDSDTKQYARVALQKMLEI